MRTADQFEFVPKGKFFFVKLQYMTKGSTLDPPAARVLVSQRGSGLTDHSG